MMVADMNSPSVSYKLFVCAIKTKGRLIHAQNYMYVYISTNLESSYE